MLDDYSSGGRGYEYPQQHVTSAGTRKPDRVFNAQTNSWTHSRRNTGSPQGADDFAAGAEGKTEFTSKKSSTDPVSQSTRKRIIRSDDWKTATKTNGPLTSIGDAFPTILTMGDCSEYHAYGRNGGGDCIRNTPPSDFSATASDCDQDWLERGANPFFPPVPRNTSKGKDPNLSNQTQREGLSSKNHHNILDHANYQDSIIKRERFKLGEQDLAPSIELDFRYSTSSVGGSRSPLPKTLEVNVSTSSDESKGHMIHSLRNDISALDLEIAALQARVPRMSSALSRKSI